MAIVVGIRFKDSGKTYFFDPRELELEIGQSVIVDTVRGPELAKVAYARHEVPDSEVVGELKQVLRPADQADFDRMRLLQLRHDEVLQRCSEKIAQHNLPMKLVKAEYSFDGSRLTFFFTSDKRVDFRMLVRDLARAFKSRIELRQIGPRDEAKLLGGIGPCGRLLCCATFLPDYARVSIKMAKDQDLPLNPAKISGVCGRLLCCLSYEHEQYLDLKAYMPNRGAWVQTPEGPGEVVAVQVLKETVMVALPGNEIATEYSLQQIQTATAQVGDVARSRVEAGIAPVKPERPPRREPRDRGERRLLRDELDHSEVIEALEMLDEGDTGGSVAGGSALSRRGQDDWSKDSNDQAPKVPAPPRYRPHSDEQSSAHTPPKAHDTRHVRSGQNTPAPDERSVQQRGEAHSRSMHRTDTGSKDHEHSEQRRGHQQHARPPLRKEGAEPMRERTVPPEPAAPSEDAQAERPSKALHRRVRRRNLGHGGQDRE